MSLINGGSEESLIRELDRHISSALNRSGIFYRLFVRIKDERSIINKDIVKGYSSSTDRKRGLQDLYGIRITVYFADDEILAQEVVRSLYKQLDDSSQIDIHPTDHFGVRRCNLIFELPEPIKNMSSLLRRYPFINPTFEVQFRTVLSEGWHEVDHDLRYKCKDDWAGQDDMSRALNGLAATLETCDWASIKMFDDLAWRHYKDKRWAASFRMKYRVRLQDASIKMALLDLLSARVDVARELFRCKRGEVLNKLWINEDTLPVTLQNLLFISNRYKNVSSEVVDLEPNVVSDWLDRFVGPFQPESARCK